MTRWRLIQDDGASAAQGLALDEALMLPYGRDERDEDAQATLRLYTYRSHCALVGRHQVLDAEVDRAACRDLGIDVGRRPTGGGAIIMGAGQLGVAVTTRAPVDEAPRDLLRRFAAGVVAGLDRVGVRSEFRGKNDLHCDGRKIAGLGLHLDGRGALLFHASVLADLDIALMLRALRIPGAPPSARAVARVGERVTTVSRELGRSVDADGIRDEIARGFATAVGVELVAARPEARETRHASALAVRKHAASDWIDGRSGPSDTHGSATIRTSDGTLRVYVGVQGTALTSVMVAGDVNALPPEIAALEARLRWLPAEPDLVGDVCDEVLGDGVLGLPSRTVAGAVWDAARQAMERTGALPVRLSGSCYFPDPAVCAGPVPTSAVAEET